MGLEAESGKEESQTGVSSSSHFAEAGMSSEEVIRRLHILPFEETQAKLGERSRMEFLGPELRRIRSANEVLRAGMIVKNQDAEFVVIKCEPAEGVLGIDTDFFLDGRPVIGFQKIQFSAWGPTELSSEELFSQCVKPIFKGEYSAHGSSDCKRVRLLYTGQAVQVGEVTLQVEATEPNGLGVVSADSEIFANWDATPEFEKVHILPFQDTLPRAYAFDLFTDYLKPYLKQNVHKRFQVNELFSYQGVQFKLVACEPEASARIGKQTTIFCEGLLNPTLRNLLPPNLLNQVAQLPPGLQMLLLNTERSTRELEDMLTHRRGLFPQTLNEIQRFTWPPQDAAATQQQTCMICLADFSIGEECRRLPCNHVFHLSCVDEWLRRCTDCPICKANVDRAIRNY
mmetsp:Transcript_84324/g.149041  ORF Transcript_84324/g.149041 Transcript_84324/m.149041 type:complete len:399 (-) Transcript_84324:84-1280(-)